MARTLRFDSIFLCTPQLVSSWIYFPAWLSIVDTCPTHLVMDGSDFESYRARASGLNASPYSVVTWDTFDAYNSHDFLVTSRRYSELARADLSHVSETASRLASRVAADREWLHQMVLHGHESWLQYGLKLRHKLQWKNSVFAQAIDQTVLEIEDIKKGVFRFDPQILLRRYLKKLLVALVIRRKSMFGKT